MARPRDPDLDRRILEAFRELADRDGIANVTISAVATASGVSRPAIYRRWHSLAALRFEVQTSRSVEGGFTDLGSLRDELVDATLRLVASMVDGDRDLTGSMLGQMVADEDFSREVWNNRWGPDTTQMYEIWQRAIDRGEVDETADGWRVMDQLVAMCIYQVMLLHRPFDDGQVEAFVDRIVEGVRR